MRREIDWVLVGCWVLIVALLAYAAFMVVDMNRRQDACRTQGGTPYVVRGILTFDVYCSHGDLQVAP